MTCDELKDDYATYALGSLDGAELDELRAHLTGQCENCTPGVRNAIALVARMAAAVKQVDPPKRLRARVIALVSPEKRFTLNWALTLVTALSVIFSIHIKMNHDAMHEVFFR